MPEQPCPNCGGTCLPGWRLKTEREKVQKEFESRESLPLIERPMKIKKVGKSECPNIPGVEAIDPNQKLDWDQFVFVRTTDIPPKLKNGQIFLETPYSGTKNRDIKEVDPRTTLHFAVNHHMRSSPGG